MQSNRNKTDSLYRIIVLLVLAISMLPLIVYADAVNLAAGHSYSLHIAASEHYPDPDKRLLTDGKVGARKNLDCGERLCALGWVGFDHGTPMITIDLGNTYRLQRISASFLSFPTKGVNPPLRIELQSSFDGLHWTARGGLEKKQGSFELEAVSWPSRFLRLVVERDQWAFLDEIRIEGNPVPIENQHASIEPIKPVLVVTSHRSGDDERYLRLANMLDGMGIGFDTAEVDQLDAIELLDYQLLVFTASSKVPLSMTQAQEQRITIAVNSGTNVLWIGGGIWGSFKNTLLADTFGVRYVGQDSNEEIGARFAEYQNLDGKMKRLPLKHETMWVVEPRGAEVDSWYQDDDGRRLSIPFITRFKVDATRGTTIYVALSLLDYWKVDETYYTYARAEILARAIRSLLTDGVVTRHPVANARDATFLLRLEDYTPGGLYMGHTSRLWMLRMERLLALTDKYQVPLNIGIIPRYNHAYLGETHDWGELDPTIRQLKRMAETAFARGGSLIVHGFDHQNGAAIDDYSGDDWETWDEDAQAFLSLDRQQTITDAAYAEIETQWGIRPVIWETPHYSSNEDTFRAAHRSGFRYFTESDTKIFPNWNGYLNRANGLLLNIPETGAYFQPSAAEVKEKTLIKQLHILPRLVRMNALFLVFYHSMSETMQHALENLLMTSRGFDLWQPNMEEYARFWEQRRQVGIESGIDRHARQIRAAVNKAFDGFTLAVQLPAGTTPAGVRIDGAVVAVKERQLAGNWILYPVLKRGTHDVVVDYQ